MVGETAPTEKLLLPGLFLRLRQLSFIFVAFYNDEINVLVGLATDVFFYSTEIKS